MKILINVGCIAFQDGEFIRRSSVANDNIRELSEVARAINGMFDWTFADDVEINHRDTGSVERNDSRAVDPISSQFVFADPGTILTWPVIPRRTPR